MGGVRKWTGWNRNERNITIGASQQFDALLFQAEEDTTIVMCHVEIAMCLEPATDPGQSSLAGYARLRINRAGNAIPLIQPSDDWDAVGGTDTLSDADSMDTWAITPFALANSGFTLTGPGSPSGPVHLTLSPKTKRSLRRGDSLSVEINYSNGGNQNAAHQESVTGTIFTQS